MIIHDCQQRSPEWDALRCGRVTSSCAAPILRIRKSGSGELAVRRDLRQRLIVERLTGIPANDVPHLPKDMKHGVDTEPAALEAYELARSQVVFRAGFVSHDVLMAGYSPDGYMGEWEGLLELKCPSSETHFEYLRDNVIPEIYVPQLIHGMWITGARWADFCSFDDRFTNPAHRLFVKRLDREGIDFDAYELAVSLLLSEVDAEVEKLMQRTEAA